MEEVGREGDIGRAGNHRRLAVVEGLEPGELVGVLQDQLAELPHQPAPLRRRQSGPRAVIEGPPCRPYRPIDILPVAFGDFGEALAGGRVDGLEGPAAGRFHPLATDQEPVAPGNEVAGGRKQVVADVADGHEVPFLSRDGAGLDADVDGLETVVPPDPLQLPGEGDDVVAVPEAPDGPVVELPALVDVCGRSAGDEFHTVGQELTDGRQHHVEVGDPFSRGAVPPMGTGLPGFDDDVHSAASSGRVLSGSSVRKGCCGCHNL